VLALDSAIELAEPAAPPAVEAALVAARQRARLHGGALRLRHDRRTGRHWACTVRLPVAG
jgi:hypothetical protein